MKGAARVGSAAAGQSWRVRVWKQPEDPACRSGDACGPLLPGHFARALPTSSSGHLSLDPLPLAGPRPPSRETPQPPRVFSLGYLRCERRREFREGAQGGRLWEGARLEETELGAGAKARAFAPPGRNGNTNWQSWKLFPHVAPQCVAE